jgi:CubicO group peptidase (beta-lactamase class C family)
MRPAITLLLVLSLINVFALTQPAAAEAIKYDKETEVALNDKSKFTISGGWTYDPSTTSLRSPEGDLAIYLHVEPFKDGQEDMTKAAWKSANKDITFKILRMTAPPSKDGWEQTHQIDYDVPVSENRTVLSLVRVFQGMAYVMLLDGANGTLDKRFAQVKIAVDTWRPDGLKKEDLSARSAKQFSADDEAELDRFISESTIALGIPGTSVAVIQNGKVVYRKGFGVKLLGSNDKVTPETLFMIGSTTKPLTTLMLSKLVEQGKLTWTTPVYDVLPSFALADQDLTKKLLIKHTACACTGMPRRDMEEVFGSKINSVDDVLKQLHSMKPTSEIGETFQYSNQLVTVGGLAGANVYNRGNDLFDKYENVMNDLVFSPLHMSSTRVKPRKADTDRLASPHAITYGGKIIPLQASMEDALYSIGPAGCIWSNVDDICQYMLMELRNGKDENGQVLFSEEQILKRRTPGIKVSEDTTYGLGLFIENDKGANIIHHAGNTQGFTAHMMFLPKHDIGLVVLSNASGVNGFREAMKQKLLEVFLGAAPKADQLIKFSVKSSRDIQEKYKLRVSIDPADCAWIGDYVGHYYNEDLGPVEVVEKNGKFEFVTPHWRSDIGSSKEQTGEKLLGLLSPPWWFAQLRVKKAPVRKLILDDAQLSYEFIEKPRR